ncbi:hypothetical protein [Nocardia vulneris]|uniref:Uncharacterized protein n=1 Tax=Nocardia vulneris TaxID=1141657 RepID=A0ABR4Z7K6_9NOCA|nr:hypothetical protein [Nocardia vulneris]KIA61124.1 hypothetical protein FG87_32870 [Nocardia vulneris]
MATLMLDHPGWLRPADGRTYRVVTDDHQAVSIVTVENLDQNLFINCEPLGPDPVPTSVGYFDPTTLTGPLTLTAPLRARGSVSRLANPHLWDALATAILAQLVTPQLGEQAYARLCRAYGRRVRTPGGDDGWLFPRPDAVTGLTRDDIPDVLLGVKLPALRLAAHAYLDHGSHWNELLPSGATATELMEAISTRLPQLLPATIARAVADHSNDFTIYPIDTTLRSRVCRLSTRHSWPVADTDFSTEWQAMTGDQQSAWTVLTLATGTDCMPTTPPQDFPTASVLES